MPRKIRNRGSTQSHLITDQSLVGRRAQVWQGMWQSVRRVVLANHPFADRTGVHCEAVARAERAEHIGAEAEGVHSEWSMGRPHVEGAVVCNEVSRTERRAVWVEQSCQSRRTVRVQDAVGRAGVVCERAARRTVHVIEPAWEVVEQNTKRLVGMHCLPAHNNSHCRTHLRDARHGGSRWRRRRGCTRGVPASAESRSVAVVG